jgi:hypothetical protein
MNEVNIFREHMPEEHQIFQILFDRINRNTTCLIYNGLQFIKVFKKFV